METESKQTAQVLVIEGLCKRYPAFSLQDFSLAVKAGTIVGLVGENGAGKSTVLKSILGLVRSDAGSILLEGRQGFTSETIGFVPEELWLYENLRVRSLLMFLSRVYSTWNHVEAQQILRQFGIGEDSRIKTLSKGNRTRLLLAIALSHDTNLLVMDEPLSSLDPVMRESFWKLLEERVHRSRQAALISSHLLYDLEEHCDIVAIIRQGRLVFSSAIDAIPRQWTTFVFTTADDQRMQSVLKAKRLGPLSYQAVLPGSREECLAQLASMGAREIRARSATLHDVFMQLAGQEL